MIESGLKTTITNTIDVENFDGRNNCLWHSDMKDAIYMLDLDLVLKETILDNTRESGWKRLNIKTYGLIRYCLAREQMYMFLQETFACSLWKVLENKCMKKSNENKLINDLVNINVTFKDEHKAILLIGSLFDELDHLCITIIHEMEKLYFEEVYSALNYEVQKKDKK